MKILALETSGSNCSVALADEEKIISSFEVNTGTTHSQNLVPIIEQIEKFSEINLNEIDALACSIGPGSFTGLRIGIATIKGMALSLNKKVISVPTLLGLAYNVGHFNGIICSVLDARNDNVYAAIYEYIGDAPIMVSPYITETISDLIDLLKSKDCDIIFVGDGAVTFKNEFKKELTQRAHFMPKHKNTQTAISIAIAAIEKAKNNEYDTEDSIAPLYLKKSQAERMLEDGASN